MCVVDLAIPGLFNKRSGDIAMTPLSHDSEENSLTLKEKRLSNINNVQTDFLSYVVNYITKREIQATYIPFFLT